MSKNDAGDEKGLDYQKIVNKLIIRGKTLLSEHVEFEPLTDIKEAEYLLHDFDIYPHAFVLSCIMDRQMTAEKAWAIPYHFMKRFGSFKFEDIKKISLEEVEKIFFHPTPLHRYPKQMALAFYQAIQDIQNKYSGDASRIWSDNPSSLTLVKRFREFHGAGPKIANMAANILVRRFKIMIKDKSAIDISADSHVQRVFPRLGLISEGSSIDEIITKARHLYPPYPGVFDYSIWEIGRKWCKPTDPDCNACYLLKDCPSSTN